MGKFPKLAGAALATGLLAACAAGVEMAAEGPGATRRTALGEVFTGAKGMTLYTYDEDKPGKSNCYGLCAVFWPPVGAPANAVPTGKFTVITRDGGAKQWAHDGHPLYGFINDSKPGDTEGDGADGVWHVARP